MNSTQETNVTPLAEFRQRRRISEPSRPQAPSAPKHVALARWCILTSMKNWQTIQAVSGKDLSFLHTMIVRWNWPQPEPNMRWLRGIERRLLAALAAEPPDGTAA